MQAIDIILALTRSLERIFIVLSGTLAIWLGYKLFDKVVSDTSELAARTTSFTFRLQRIGPGVLFAAFGCAVLGFALSRTLALDPPNPTGSSTRRYLDASLPVTEKQQAAKVLLAWIFHKPSLDPFLG